jgi:hypothetical protein
MAIEREVRSGIMAVKFGVFVPQGWKMDLVGIPDPAEQYEAMTRVARAADEAGFDSIWVFDHFHTIPTPTQETTFECWTITAGGTHHYAQPPDPAAAPRLPTARWYHLAGTYDGRVINLYVDGVLAYSAEAPGGITPFSGDLTFGRNANLSWDQRFFSGDLAEIRLWDHARSAADILANKDLPLPRPQPGLAGWWPLTEGSGLAIGDRSGNGHSGILHDVTWTLVQ